MRARVVGAIFVAGLVAVGVAAAGLNDRWNAHATGDNEVPVPTGSQAQAQANFKLSDDGLSLSYKLNVGNIENVTQAHIHMAPAGSNGMIVVWLYPNTPPLQPTLIPGRSSGTLGEGTITAANLTGPLSGQPLSALVNAINAGNAYVNVHTSQFPPGEVRGQVG
jgi:hypothetical protein